MGNEFGKLLIIIGVIITCVGFYLVMGGKFSILGKLPGDIRIERENFSFYFPLGTCLLISALLTLIMWIMKR